MSNEDIRKRRGDAMEAKWSDTQVMTLRDGFLSGWTYEKAKSWLSEEGLAGGSNGALHGFWEFHCAPVLRERRRMAAMKAEEIARAAEEDQVDWSSAALDRLQQLTFEFLLSQDPETIDSKAVAGLMKVILKDRALEQDDRKLRMLEEKARQAKEALERATTKAKERGGVTEETLRELEEAAKLL